MGLLESTLRPSHRPANLTAGKEPKVSDALLEKARADTDAVLKELGSRPDGLSTAEADSRVKQYALNEVAREKRQSALAQRRTDSEGNMETLEIKSSHSLTSSIPGGRPADTHSYLVNTRHFISMRQSWQKNGIALRLRTECVDSELRTHLDYGR